MIQKQKSNPCLIKFLRKRKISKDKICQAAQCAYRKCQVFSLFLKPFTLFMVFSKNVLENNIFLKHLPCKHIYNAFSMYVFSIISQELRPADSKHALYYLLPIIYLPKMCRLAFFCPFLFLFEVTFSLNVFILVRGFCFS